MTHCKLDTCPGCGDSFDPDGYCFRCGYDAVEAYFNNPERRQKIAESWDDYYDSQQSEED